MNNPSNVSCYDSPLYLADDTFDISHAAVQSIIGFDIFFEVETALAINIETNIDDLEMAIFMSIGFNGYLTMR